AGPHGGPQPERVAGARPAPARGLAPQEPQRGRVRAERDLLARAVPARGQGGHQPLPESVPPGRLSQGLGRARRTGWWAMNGAAEPRERIAVCGLVPYPPDTAPSQRFRIEQWQPHLHAQGIDVTLVPFADERLMTVLHRPGHLAAKTAGVARAFVRRCRDVARARRYDAILVHRAA